jgi:hypothetical protein
VLTAVPGLFGFFLPDPLGAKDKDPQHLRMQQAKGIVASLALGAAGSAVTKTPWPFLLAVSLTGLLMWEYQTTALRGRGEA